MRRIGILSFPSPGHFYPLTALGRRLQSRGHEVVYSGSHPLGTLFEG
jgi:zeaxanthin glucosyltransferase